MSYIVRVRISDNKVLPIACEGIEPDKILKDKIRIIKPKNAPLLITALPDMNFQPKDFWVVDVDAIDGYAEGDVVEVEPEEAKLVQKPKPTRRKRSSRAKK